MYFPGYTSHRKTSPDIVLANSGGVHEQPSDKKNPGCIHRAYCCVHRAGAAPRQWPSYRERYSHLSRTHGSFREHAYVVIRDGRIAEVGTKLVPGPQVRRIDGTGRFLIPGLIDSHVHVGHSAALDDNAIEAHPELWAAYRAQVPRAYLAFGFTSILDLDLASGDKSWFEGTPLHPHLYSCGEGIKVAGGYMAFNVPPVSSPNFPNLVYEPKEAEHWPKSLDARNYTAERAVTRAADAGATCVKAYVESGFGSFSWPYLQTDTLQKIQIAAKQHNLVLIGHANSVDSWRSALDAHADIIAHGLWV